MLSELWTTLLAELQALYVGHQSAHWRASGESFYSDHQMHQRMYESILGEIDQVAEKLLGITGDSTLLDPNRTAAATMTAMKMMGIGTGYPSSSLLIAEKTFLKQLTAACEAFEAMCQLTDGTENLLQAIADKHEEHVYLLSRRAGVEALRVCVGEAISSMPSMSSDIKILKERILEKKKRKKRKKKSWNIGGPISTGPGNPGFNSSAGPACDD